MRPRTSAHDQAIARRLELLSAELARDRPAVVDEHTRVRPARTVPERGASDPWAPGSVEAPSPGPAEPGEVPALVSEEVAAGTPPQVRVPEPGRHAARRRLPGSRWLPEAWLERTALGPGPVAVVAVLAALGLAVACWWLLRAQPEPVQLEATSAGGLATPVGVTSAGASGGATGGATSDAGAAQEVVVDVAGRVRRPGIVVLEPGARVVDAIEAAGGLRRGARPTGLNLARVLADGEQVLVGVPPAAGATRPGQPAAPGGAAGTGGTLNLNTATSDQLQELPGIGPVTAEAILAFRADHGPFTSVEELLDVTGIGDATLAEIAPHVTV